MSNCGHDYMITAHYGDTKCGHCGATGMLHAQAMYWNNIDCGGEDQIYFIEGDIQFGESIYISHDKN